MEFDNVNVEPNPRPGDIYHLQQPLINRNQGYEAPYDPVMPVMPIGANDRFDNNILAPPDVRRRSFHDHLFNMINGVNPGPIDRNTMANLRRVNFNDERRNLDDEECSICLLQFNEFPNERLIYLPCNRKHIFHSNCILSWLQNDNT